MLERFWVIWLKISLPNTTFINLGSTALKPNHLSSSWRRRNLLLLDDWITITRCPQVMDEYRELIWICKVALHTDCSKFTQSKKLHTYFNLIMTSSIILLPSYPYDRQHGDGGFVWIDVYYAILQHNSLSYHTRSPEQTHPLNKIDQNIYDYSMKNVVRRGFESTLVNQIGQWSESLSYINYNPLMMVVIERWMQAFGACALNAIYERRPLLVSIRSFIKMTFFLRRFDRKCNHACATVALQSQ